MGKGMGMGEGICGGRDHKEERRVEMERTEKKGGDNVHYWQVLKRGA